MNLFRKMDFGISENVDESFNLFSVSLLLKSNYMKNLTAFFGSPFYYIETLCMF